MDRTAQAAGWRGKPARQVPPRRDVSRVHAGFRSSGRRDTPDMGYVLRSAATLAPHECGLAVVRTDHPKEPQGQRRTPLSRVLPGMAQSVEGVWQHTAMAPEGR